VKTLLATYQQVEDLINIGAYKPGTRPEIDRAIEKREEILDFLRQGLEQSFRWEETMDQLAGLVQ